MGADELKQIAGIWGTRWADILVTDPRWPKSNQRAVIAAAGLIVETAIGAIVKIMDTDDFAPHLELMAVTMRETFWLSMPPSNRPRADQVREI